MLDPVKLRVLRSVVETGSIRASAEALGYTPSAISQHLTSLRRETGLELVERSGRGIHVTAHARLLADEAGPALDALDAVERTAKDLRSGRIGRLRFGYATSIAGDWIPELARDVRRRYPDLGLDLTLRDCQGDGVLEDSGLDIVVGDGEAPSRPSAEWEYQEILEEGYVALVGAGHPLAGRPSLLLKELADEAWVTDDPLDSYWFDRICSACRAAGFSPRVDVNPNDYSTVLGFVASGDYVSVQPSVIARDMRPDVVAIPLDPPAPRRRLRVQVRRATSRNPAVQYIVERIHAVAAMRAEEIPGVIYLGSTSTDRRDPRPPVAAVVTDQPAAASAPGG
ncbi:LysR family transcriptional regulator [Brachybacterium sp. GCM10030268]|uniref:LysR family transcriptional regulator n=1 Tax=Brachybacterium sp. GCM10030268 TaxID=3273382 RepID=UPI0036223082